MNEPFRDQNNEDLYIIITYYEVLSSKHLSRLI